MPSKLVKLFSRLPFFRKKERESSYYKNLKKLLEDLLASGDGEAHPIHCYSADDLIRATNNFHPSRIVQNGSSYEIFTGFLDGRSIIVKKYPFGNGVNEDRRRSWVIRDIVISLQMSHHENVLKFLGCCLEFPIPVLVHEYVAKGVLNRDGSLKGVNEDQIILPWNIRLRIAKQLASAVSYLHTAFAGAIIHRNLEPSCLFLDDDYVPKLYDFSLSITIPPMEADVEDAVTDPMESDVQDYATEDAVAETVGYTDPVYLYSGRITKRTDVYSFGVLLLVFLTGREPWEFYLSEGIGIVPYVRGCNGRTGEGREPWEFYLSEGIEIVPYVRGCNGRTGEIVDPKIYEEVRGNEQVQRQLHDFLELALLCTRDDIEGRPYMVGVARELIRIEEFVLAS